MLHCTAKNWLLLVESVTSNGPVDGMRHAELARLFADSTAGRAYVTAIPDRTSMRRYLTKNRMEIRNGVADAPSRLIHFNGVRVPGPYTTEDDVSCSAWHDGGTRSRQSLSTAHKEVPHADLRPS